MLAAAGLLAWAGALGVWAAENPQYTVDVWDREKGLPEMAVFALTQTQDGYLWLGTGDGLARFDGITFKSYEESDTVGLSGSKVVKLFEDSQRNLWIGTDAAGVLLLSPQGKLSAVVPGERAGQGPVVNICEDQAGGIWLRLSTGQVYWYSNGKASLLKVRDCRGLMAEDSGLVWLALPDGRLVGLGPVSSSTTAGDLRIAYEVPYGYANGNLDYLLASRRGGYWRLANGRIQKWRVDHLERDYGAYPWHLGVPVLAACEDLDGHLIVGTYSEGVYWMDAQGTMQRVKDLPHSSIFCLTLDQEGDLWVGSNGGGLNRIKRQGFQPLEGTEGTAVQSVCEDDLGGLWIGHNSERVDHWSGNSLQQFTNLWPQAGGVPPGTTRFAARAVLEDSAHRVWVGGSSEVDTNPPLLLFQGGQFYPVADPQAPRQPISVLYQDRQGTLWVGTHSGLAFNQNGVWKWVLPDAVRGLAEDRAGALWVGTEEAGLKCLRNRQVTTFHHQAEQGLPNDHITSLYVDSQDVLWVGTISGLARYDHGHWTRYTTHEGLASNKIGYLLEDDRGNLWIGSTAGLMRLSKASLNEFAAHPVGALPCRIFGKADGLPNSECSSGSQPGACRTRAGLLCFPTISGLVLLDPAKLQTNTNPPPVLIESVRIDDRPISPEGPLRTLPPREVTVPAGTESFEVTFTSLNLAAPDKGLFKYRMENYENGWTLRSGNVRYARYSRLPHGHYTFQVLACNEDGVWNNEGASLSVTVLPPFWQTWWFMSASSLCLLGLVVGSVHYVSTQKLQRQLAVLRQHEALERERARIARDLHDQLGANLTQVALLSEMAESDKEAPAEVEAHARQIAQTARETTRALDEIVWTVNPSNDTLDGLINYVCKYAQEYLALAGLRYRLEVPPELPARPISPEMRHNVFLAAKEAVNNVVKHAGATAVWLRLKLEPGRFILEIEDDGRGLTPEAQKKGRNGLRNMRKRLEDIAGQCEFTPGREGGTIVRLEVPLAGSGEFD